MNTLKVKKGLSSELLHKLCEIKCEECRVNFDYCFNHIIKVNPSSREEFENEMEEFLAVAYFEDFYALYAGIIPYRECASTADEALEQYNEKEAMKKENLN